MKLLGDIKHSWLIHLKGFLFLALGGLSAGVVLAELPTLKIAFLLGLAVWSFCRFYYYLFYVLERYLGRERRFAGVFDALQFVLFRSKEERPNGDGRES